MKNVNNSTGGGGKGFISYLKKIKVDILWGEALTPLGGEEIHSSSVCCALESSSSTEKESCISKCQMKNENMFVKVIKVDLIFKIITILWFKIKSYLH